MAEKTADAAKQVNPAAPGLDSPTTSPPGSIDPSSADESEKHAQRVARYIDVHAPTAWTDGTVFTREETASLLDEELRLRKADLRPMLVLCADIRKSTLIMRESNDLWAFAYTLGDFMEFAETTVRNNHGWFDKFTGDGFLAYWIPQCLNETDQFPEDPEYDPASGEPDAAERWLLSSLEHAAIVASTLLNFFQKTTLPDFIATAGNFVPDVGLSWGLDAGQAQLVEMAGDLTIVGRPVVGSVRMVSCARPWEAIANVFLGELLLRLPDHVTKEVASVGLNLAETKEYKEQLVYPLEFAHFKPPLRPTSRS